MPNLRSDLPFSTDVPAFETTEPNHANIFNQRAQQGVSNDAYLKSEVDGIKLQIQNGLPANGGDSHTVDGCHAGTAAGEVLKLDPKGKVVPSALNQAVKKWWQPSTAYAVGESVQPLEFARHFIYVCTTAGTTSATQPTWLTTDEATLQDGTVTWKTVDIRDAATLDGHKAGTNASDVLVLDSGAKIPLGVISFIQNNKIAESFLNAAVKRWWMPSVGYTKGQVIQPILALNGQCYECVQTGTTGTNEPAWPTGEYAEFTDGTVKWRVRSMSSMGGNVGDVRFPAMAVKPNELKLNGAILSRADYPELWAYAQTTHMVVEADWGNGHCGKFSVADGTANFRLPDLRGLFPRVLDEGKAIDPDYNRSMGQTQGDAIRNITGTFRFTGAAETDLVSGAFACDGSYGSYTHNSQMMASAKMNRFAASLVVPTALENRPINAGYYAVIRYK